jgi:hypothetical protein
MTGFRERIRTFSGGWIGQKSPVYREEIAVLREENRAYEHGFQREKPVFPRRKVGFQAFFLWTSVFDSVSSSVKAIHNI